MIEAAHRKTQTASAHRKETIEAIHRTRKWRDRAVSIITVHQAAATVASAATQASSETSILILKIRPGMVVMTEIATSASNRKRIAPPTPTHVYNIKGTLKLMIYPDVVVTTRTAMEAPDGKREAVATSRGARIKETGEAVTWVLSANMKTIGANNQTVDTVWNVTLHDRVTIRPSTCLSITEKCRSLLAKYHTVVLRTSLSLAENRNQAGVPSPAEQQLSVAGHEYKPS
jgi:hypothetical protein